MIKFLRITNSQLRSPLRLDFRSTFTWLTLTRIFGLVGLIYLCLPAKSRGQDVGVGVFGDMAIHDQTLAVWGNLFLDRVQVRGTLILADRKPQHIIARRSRVDCLNVSNLTRVILHGKLTIDGELCIDGGIFDARSAVLILSDSVKLVITRGGHLYPKFNSSQYGSTRDTYTGLSDPVPVALLPVEICWWRYREARSVIFAYRGSDALLVVQMPDYQPPEC